MCVMRDKSKIESRVTRVTRDGQMHARYCGEKVRQHAVSQRRPRYVVVPAKTIDVHVYVHAHIDLPTCDQI